MNGQLTRNDNVFRYPLDVRFFEVDSLGVVFNMWYLGWCDEAMSAFMDSIGFGYEALREQGFDAVLRKAEIEWLDSLQAFQHAEVAVRVDQIGKTSFRLHYDIERVDIERGDIERGDIERGDIERGDIERGDIERGDIERGDIERGDIERGDPSAVDTQRVASGRTRCATAAITYVCVQIDGRTKTSIPSDLREALERGHRGPRPQDSHR